MELVAAYLKNEKELKDNEGVFIYNEKEVPFVFTSLSIERRSEPFYKIGNMLPVGFDDYGVNKLNLSLIVSNNDIYNALNHFHPMHIRFKDTTYFGRIHNTYTTHLGAAYLNKDDMIEMNITFYIENVEY